MSTNSTELQNPNSASPKEHTSICPSHDVGPCGADAAEATGDAAAQR
jgi:hypothetical protein